MNETDAWNYFMQTGHVNDYLAYLSIQKALKPFLKRNEYV